MSVQIIRHRHTPPFDTIERLPSFDDDWPLIEITFSVLATFTSVTILVWLLLYVISVP